MSDHGNSFVEIGDAVRHLDCRMDVRFDAVDRRFEALDLRLDGIDQTVSRQFVWLVGMQMTTLIAIVGALLSRG